MQRADGYALERQKRLEKTISQRAGWNVILPATMDESDAAAIDAVLRGNVDRYADLVDKYQQQAIRLAFSLLGNEADAQDVSQEAFVSAYRSLGQFRGGAKFSTWLYRIVVNKCKDAYKRHARRPFVVAQVGEAAPDSDDEGSLFVDVADPTTDPSDHLATRELSQQITAAIGTLPMKQRTAFILHHVQGCSLEEAAVVMDCRVGTVKSHVFRATEHLRVQLTPWLEKEGR